jgi:D-3-phosphoglycerate dehydrogenase
MLKECSNLKLISVRGVGYDYIDTAVCAEMGIAISRAVGTVGKAVSELAMAYMLHFARKVSCQNEAMQRGKWERIMTEGLGGKTLGIFGFGEIGQALAKKAEAFDMKVRYFCRTPKDNPDYLFSSPDEIYANSDYIVLAIPLCEETRKMIDENALSKMKKNAVLINIARAGIVDNNALCNAVKNEIIRGAAVDVYENEPCTDSTLKGVNGIILTPHTAPFTKQNFIDMNMLAAQNVIDYFNGSIDKKYLVRG